MSTPVKYDAAHWAKVHAEAEAAATAAMAGIPDRGTCGVAWVDIKRASAKGLVRYLRESRIGHSIRHGWQVYRPGEYHGQGVTEWEAGATAYADVLRGYGIDCDVGSRID